MRAIHQILFMILLLSSGIGYVIYNYLNGRTSEMMMILSVAILGASLLNMLVGLYRAIRDK